MSPQAECIPCLLEATLRMLKATEAGELDRNNLMEYALDKVREKKDREEGPKILGEIARRFLESTDRPDPFDRLKHPRTALAHSVLPDLRRELTHVDDPVSCALTLSTLANNPDLLAPEQNRRLLVDRLTNLCQQDFGLRSGCWQQMLEDIEAAEKIFIIGDNAGELVFDLLLLEQLREKELFYGVCGQPVLNAATEVEALEAGIYRWAKIISSGTPTPGTILNEVDGEFRAAFETADVVLAKGQGNFKTLANPPRPVYYLFVVQCEVLALELDRETEEPAVEKRPAEPAKT